jgi:RNA polymerase sigma factor for flagellar operon FliA
MTASYREELILSHMPQVRVLARRLHRRCPQVELDDLISTGTIGFIHRIRGAMLDYLRHIDPLPRSVRRFQKQRDLLIAQFSTAGEILSEARIAQALGVSSRKYVMLLQMITAAEPISIFESTVAGS